MQGKMYSRLLRDSVQVESSIITIVETIWDGQDDNLELSWLFALRHYSSAEESSQPRPTFHAGLHPREERISSSHKAEKCV